MIEAHGEHELLLDPFSFFPGVASRISGLGGSDPGHDHTYAFHTPYVEVAPGRAHFSLRFQGLTARRGSLKLWVHMLPLEQGARARVVNSERIQINRLIQQGGLHSIPFEAFHGVSFALHGAVLDETDAQAASLVVALDRPADPNNHAAAVEARTSIYGQNETKAVVQLISTKPATLREPVCQCATRAQLREKEALAILERMPLRFDNALAGWCHAYLARALECYGVLKPGAAGLGFGPDPRHLGSALRAFGPDITVAATLPGVEGALCIDPSDIPRELVNFDFLWSMGVGDQMASPGAMTAFVEATMSCLRPGGLAVHLLPYDPEGDRFSWSNGSGPFTRNEVERLALTMISRGHMAAQIRIDTDEAIRLTPGDSSYPVSSSFSQFGVILRRAPSAF